MTDQAPELKPCPFCGGEADYHYDVTTEQSDSVYCSDCCATLGDFNLDGPQGTCVAAWNTRADLAAPKVRPLEWFDYGKPEHPNSLGSVAEVLFNHTYRVDRCRLEWECWWDKKLRPSLEEAKAAAQTDYERRINSALEGGETPAPQWQPIEGACITVDEVHMRGLWVNGPNGERWWEVHIGLITESGEWVEPEFREPQAFDAENYSHWMPIPAAPAPDLAQEREGGQ